MIVVRQFDNVPEVNLFLQGGVRAGNKLPITGGEEKRGVFRLNGKTLILSKPAAKTITFASPNGVPEEPIPWEDIKSQIETQSTGTVKARLYKGRLELIEPTPSAGVTVVKTGTANALLGFQTSADVAGTVYNSDFSTSPYFVELTHSSFSSNMVLVTEE